MTDPTPMSNEMEWRDIATAPKDGTEILICNPQNYNATIGVYGAMDIFGLPDREAEAIDEETYWAEDWWAFDYYGAHRLEGDVAPTKWQPLPAPPPKEGGQ